MQKAYTVSLAMLLGFLVLTGACSPTAPAAATRPAPVENITIVSVEKTGGLLTTRYQIPVSMSAADPTQYKLAAWLTTPSDGQDVALVTVPGSTYGHAYWDFPYQPDTYSFTRAMAEDGYTVLNIDRLGSGESSRPNGSITGDVQAFVVHQVVQDLRAGAIGQHAYKKVFLVGHSLGSCVIIQEAATYADGDGLIITGLLHSQSFPGQGLSSLTPLMENSFLSGDPIFKDVPYSSYTTAPGKRGEAFYNVSEADPQVLNTDEQTKTITPLSENNVFLAVKLTDRIKVPIFFAVGEVDRIFDAPPSKLTIESVRSGESQYYPASAGLTFFVLQGAGHDINLQRGAPQWYQAAGDWLGAESK